MISPDAREVRLAYRSTAAFLIPLLRHLPQTIGCWAVKPTDTRHRPLCRETDITMVVRGFATVAHHCYTCNTCSDAPPSRLLKKSGAFADET